MQAPSALLPAGYKIQCFRYNKSSKKRKRKGCSSLTKQSSNQKNKKRRKCSSSITKAKGKCALIERSMIGLNS
jgi:hypothetical protein